MAEPPTGSPPVSPALPASSSNAKEVGESGGVPERLSSRDEKRLSSGLSLTCYVLLFLLGGGLIVTIVQVQSHVTAALLWAFACLAMGSVGGFLFAIPRVPIRLAAVSTKKESGTTQSGANESAQALTPAGPHERGFGLGINTNLEEISDWLTKILVGLGLVELRALPELLQRAGYYVGHDLGSNGQSVGSAIVVYYLGLGFLCGYLLTRMFIGPMFRLADQATSVGVSDELAETRALVAVAREESAANSDVDTAMEELSKQSPPPARVDQLIQTLKNHRRKNPLHRKLNIVLARLYVEGKKNYDEGLRVLERYVDLKKSAGELDEDASDAYFNIACYYSHKIAIAATDEIRKELEDQSANALLECLKIRPESAKDALIDKDLEELQKSGRAAEVVEKIKRLPPKGEEGRIIV